jgi:putative tryptophan/tyrosine transport system substrate-binding protein
MRRRDVITLLGGAAVLWPLRARAQQSAVPVVGFVSSLSPGDLTFVMPAFHQGLNAAGFAIRSRRVIR